MMLWSNLRVRRRLSERSIVPVVEEGDLLAVLNAGAYGFSMSSQYNARPRAAEVLIRQGKPAMIREREQLDNLTANQKMAD